MKEVPINFFGSVKKAPEPGPFEFPFQADLPPQAEPEDSEPQVRYEVEYGIFDTEDPEQKQKLQDIMTRAWNGDVYLAKEESTFTKEGRYLVAIKWARGFKMEDDEKV